MKAFARRFICRLVILSVVAAPYSAHTQAALIGTDQAVSRVQAQAERDKLHGFVARAEVRNQLAAFGLSAAAAAERVNALTDDEVQELAGRIDALPAGANATFVAVVFILVLLVLLFVGLRRL